MFLIKPQTLVKFDTKGFKWTHDFCLDLIFPITHFVNKKCSKLMK